MTWAALASDYRQLLADAEALRDDHSPAAIFRRARRASYSNAPKSRRWKARAIGLNPDPLHNADALSGMAPMQLEERWHLAVAVPQPSPLTLAIDPDIEVVLIDPATGHSSVMSDHTRALVAPTQHQERITITTDARAWARDIALHRLEWLGLRAARRNALQAEPTWTGEPTSALILGPLSRVRWSDIRADVIDVPADLRRNVQRAVYDQARLPRIEGRA